MRMNGDDDAPQKEIVVCDSIGNSAVVTEKDGVVVVIKKVDYPKVPSSGYLHGNPPQGIVPDRIPLLRVAQPHTIEHFSLELIPIGKITGWFVDAQGHGLV